MFFECISDCDSSPCYWQDGGGNERAALNQQVKAGSKEEEIQAICKIHGVDENAPLSLVLKVCIYLV